MGHFRTWLMGEAVTHLPLTVETANGLHQQFLGLIRVTLAAKNYAEAMEAIRRLLAYKEAYTNLFLSSNDYQEKSQFEKMLLPMVRQYWHYLGHTEQIEKVEYFRSWFRKEAGDFYDDMVPYMRIPEYYTEQQCFDEFARDRGKWARRAREKSKRAAKAIAWLAEHMPRHFDDENPPSFRLPVYKPTTVDMHGFRVAVMDYDPAKESGDSSPAHQDRQIRMFREALRIFRERGQQYFPWIVKNAIPIRLYMGLANTCGAKYEGRGPGQSYVDCWIGITPEPIWAARTVAHEFGHHYWRSVLSESARKSWREMVYNPSVEVKPSDVLASVPSSERRFIQYIKERDPVGYLRLSGAYYDPGYRKDITLRSDLEDMPADEPLHLRRFPITGYAAKNPEEAFCEAVSLLVGNGPSFVSDHVLRWLRTVTGGDARP